MSDEINPYQPPQGSSPSMPRRRLAGCARGSFGCGCLLPVVLFVISALSGDTGGPLFWPILVLFGAAVGAVIGAIFAPEKGDPPSKPEDSK